MSHPAETLCAEYFAKILKPLTDAGVTFWVAGGAIRSWFQDRKVTSDIDVWFPCESEWRKAKETADKVWKLTKETAATANYAAGRNWIQLVRKHYFSTPEATIEAFDFTVSCGATDCASCYFHPYFFIDLCMNRLAFNKITYPLSTWRRCQKYAEKGFKLCPDEEKKLLAALKEELAFSTIEEANTRYME
jgi:hypothetical protein